MLTGYAGEDADGCEANGGIAYEAKVSDKLLLVAQFSDPSLSRVYVRHFSHLKGQASLRTCRTCQSTAMQLSPCNECKDCRCR